jgi:type VII secretion protein EccB
VQSRRDHVQAYQFSVARLVRAAATGEAGSGELPVRRSSLGVVAGCMAGGLLCAGMLLYGVISPKPTAAWRDPGAIIVDKATGSRYVYLNGRLRPTANYASALLITGQQASLQMVADSTLAGVPVGPPIGISGAPESVPAAAALLPGSWALCLGSNSSTVLDLAPAGRTTALPARTVALALAPGRTPGSTVEYVVLGSTRYLVTNPAVLPALGLGTLVPLRTTVTWIEQLPAGPALTPAPLSGAGSQGPQVGGRPAVIGQVFDAVGAGVNQYYVLESDGLAPIDATEAALFGSLPGAAVPVQLSPGQVSAAPASTDKSLLTRLPDLLGGIAYNPAGGGAAAPGAETDLCLLQASGAGTAGPALVTENAAALAGTGPVRVPPDAGVLVETAQSRSLAEQDGAEAGSGSPGVYLVADPGERFPVGGQDAAAALGYSQAPVRILPQQILDLIAQGPALVVADALKEPRTS